MQADLLRRIVNALERAAIPYMVTGSLASALHGEPRATRDIDLVIDPTLKTVNALIDAFPEGRFYVGDAAAALSLRDMFNIVDVETGWKVDLIICKDRPFSREELRRRRPATIAGVDTYVSTPEDAILSKLEWHAMSGSDVQRRDVLEMLIANLDRLERRYLDYWANELDVAQLLQQLWTEAETER